MFQFPVRMGREDMERAQARVVEALTEALRKVVSAEGVGQGCGESSGQERFSEGGDVVRIEPEDVEFDEEGRVIIKNPEVARRVRSWLKEREGIYIGAERAPGNSFCINGVCPVP